MGQTDRLPVWKEPGARRFQAARAVGRHNGAMFVRPAGNSFTLDGFYRTPDGVFTIPAPQAASFLGRGLFFMARFWPSRGRLPLSRQESAKPVPLRHRGRALLGLPRFARAVDTLRPVREAPGWVSLKFPAV